MSNQAKAKDSQREQIPGQHSLLQALSAKTGMALIIGAIIGSGIFMVPSSVATQVGSPSLSLLVWIFGGLLAFAGALCFAEMGAAMPRSGGTYVFLRRAYQSDLFSFCFGWAMLFIIMTGAIAAVATAFARYAGGLFEIENVWTERFVAVGCILFLTLMNSLGVKIGGWLQNVFAFVKVGAVLAVIAAGILWGSGSEVAWTPLIQEQTGSSLIGGLSLAMLGALFAYNGWFFVTFMSDEVKNPQRSIPRAILGAFAIVLTVYILANIVYLSVLSFEELQISRRVAADTLQILIGPSGAVVISAFIMLTSFGTVNAQLMATPRIYYAMAKEGQFFRMLQFVHPKFRTPIASIVIQGVWASVFALTGTFVQLVGLATFYTYVFLMLAVIGLMILRRKEPDLPRPYRTWGYPITPLLFLMISAGVLVNAFVTDYTRPLLGLVILAIGLPFYFYWKSKSKTESPAID